MDKYELMESEIPVAPDMCYAVYSGRVKVVEHRRLFRDLPAWGGRSRKAESLKSLYYFLAIYVETVLYV